MMEKEISYFKGWKAEIVNMIVTNIGNHRPYQVKVLNLGLGCKLYVARANNHAKMAMTDTRVLSTKHLLNVDYHCPSWLLLFSGLMP